VTALVPYLAYARKDRRAKDQDPVTTRYVAQLFEAMGVDCVVALEVHNRGAFDNAFRCQTVHLEAHSLFVDALIDRVGDEPAVIVSPDAGGTKRVDRFRDAWADATGVQPPTAFLEKRRSNGKVTGDAVIGDMTGKVAIIVDDMVASGTTLLRAADACKDKGATRVFGVITHGLFGPGSEQLYRAVSMDQLFITDSVTPQQKPEVQGLVTTLPVAALFAQAVRELHT
ncbi:MAG: ribose-phosphate diphosphokinase, partial [Marinobacter sp.]|nr:ribose-phosphate diphosphokinase [Marinobacter sp.]